MSNGRWDSGSWATYRSVHVDPVPQAGTYRLTWRITGADGHRLTGTIAFRVRR